MRRPHSWCRGASTLDYHECFPTYPHADTRSTSVFPDYHTCPKYGTMGCLQIFSNTARVALDIFDYHQCCLTCPKHGTMEAPPYLLKPGGHTSILDYHQSFSAYHQAWPEVVVHIFSSTDKERLHIFRLCPIGRNAFRPSSYIAES